MLTIAYDGTDYAGWQVQNKQRTVQDVVQVALCKISGRPIQVRAAGRTDSGVHAIGQIANFWTVSNILGTFQYFWHFPL